MVRWSSAQAELRQRTGWAERPAARALQFARGESDEAVVDMGPPKSLSVQTSLCVTPRQMIAADHHVVSSAGGPAGVFTPVHVHEGERRGPWRQLHLHSLASFPL